MRVGGWVSPCALTRAKLAKNEAKQSKHADVEVIFHWIDARFKGERKCFGIRRVMMLRRHAAANVSFVTLALQRQAIKSNRPRPLAAAIKPNTRADSGLT